MKKIQLEDVLPIIQQTLKIPKEEIEVVLNIPLDIPEKLEIFLTYLHQEEEYMLKLTHTETRNEPYKLRLEDSNKNTLYKNKTIMTKPELISKIEESQKLLPKIKKKPLEIEGSWIRGKFYEKRKIPMDYRLYSRLKKQSLAF